jgi:integrase
MGAGGDKMATIAPGKTPRKQSERGKQRGPFTTVKFGSAVVPIYETRSGGRVRYCLSYYRDGERLRQFFPDLEAAKREARFVAHRIQSGLQHVTDLKPHERDCYVKATELLAGLDVPLVAAIEEYVQARKIAEGVSLTTVAAEYRRVFESVTERKGVPAIVEEMLEAKAQDGASRSYLSNLRTVLRRFAAAFTGEILGITSADIDRWLRSLDLSNSSRNSMLVLVKVFFSFARERNYLPANQQTAAEQVKRLKQGQSSAALYAPAEMERLLHAAPMHLVPFLVLGAFAGIRSVEITRLDWSAIDLERRIITISAGVAKTRSRRVIPIPDNLAAWLEPFPKSGRVILSGEVLKEATALARSLGLTWPRNVLRHSFITYRLATVKSADQVALEAGNSPAVVFKHYHELGTEQDAEEWNSILPNEGQWEVTHEYDRSTRTVKRSKKKA